MDFRTRKLAVKARQGARALGFVTITGGMLSAFALKNAMTDEAERDALRDRWVRKWSASLLRLFGVHVHSRGSAKESGRGRLIVCNHRSTIDIAVLLREFGGFMVSRGDLADWPVVGAAARKVGTVFVNRTDAMSGAKAVRSIRELLRMRQAVSIFPEGTTFEGDEVRPFHAGSFLAALRSGAEIIPVGIAYERGSGAAFVNEPFTSHLKRMAASPPTHVAIVIGDAIRIEDRMRAAELSRTAHDAVVGQVKKARDVIDAVSRRNPAVATFT